MARDAHMAPDRIVKHFAVPETSLVPSFIARQENLAQIIAGGRKCMMESDYMDDNTRPGAVIGPKSVPRFTRRLLETEQVTSEQMWKVHHDTPSKVYGVSIER
jgi:TatD-related deoxyribonuclease